MENTISIFCEGKMYSRMYATTVEIRTEELNINPESWMYRLLLLISEGSVIKKLHTSGVTLFFDAIKLGCNNEIFNSVKNLLPDDLSDSSLRDMFFQLEEELRQSEFSPSTKHKMSQSFRCLIFEWIDRLCLKNTIHRQSVGFKSSMKYKRNPREMISDFADLTAPEGLDVPIGAIEFESINELHNKALEKVEFDLSKIVEAGGRELELHEEFRKYLKACREIDPGRTLLNLVRRLLNKKITRPAWESCGIFKKSCEIIVSAVLQVIEDDRLCYLDREYNPSFEWFSRYADQLGKRFGVPIMGRRLFFLENRLESLELKAIFNILLCHTGWNAGSLIEMERSSITPEEGGYCLVGYKEKTDNYTPPVHLDKYYSYGKKAVDLLIWNSEQLIKFGLLDKNEQRLWFSWGLKFAAYENQSIGIFVDLRSFTRRHGLPDYSYEQIRTQVMAKDILANKGSIDPVRRSAGHKLSITTHGYLQQLVFHRLASAVNLDFQRKFESTILWRLKEKGFAGASKSTSGPKNLLDLTPIGDGTSCRSPTDVPPGLELVGGICRAEHCHLNGGCPNQMIVIDKEALRALVRKRKYYIGNWQRLYLENRHKFEAIHANAFLFNIALYDYIKDSNYSGFLREVEREIG
ncbi:hypothetical protein [Amphritea sp.]|uniref:hypothetical protein n=1 Tax=Amphritea sp. TaxID=1872502 RepID=UPI003A955CDB